MKFNKNLDWLKESDEENILADDDLDAVKAEECSAQKNESLNTKEVTKELDSIQKGYGWVELDYFTSYLSGNVDLKELERFINTSGIAKVKKVRDLRNTSSMEDFADAGLAADDKIIVTKMPGSSRFYGESAQKNEAKVNLTNVKAEVLAAIKKYYNNDKDMLEYVYVDAKSFNGKPMIEVRAELGYSSMAKLTDYLDKVIQKYDANAYFEMADSGIAQAIFESAQKNEAIGPDEIVSYSRQMDFKKQYLKGKDARKVNSNSFYFDGNNAVDDNTGSNIPGAKLGMKYKELAAALDKFFGESAQKNEATMSNNDINFENIGCGFEVAIDWANKGYEIYCSGYSNNTGKKLNFKYAKPEDDGYEFAKANATKIAKELKAAADKLDKEVLAIFTKYGYKKQ